MSETDLELLARYARQHAEDAFTEIVRRHLGLVFSAALRQVRSPQLAEEVAQSVFSDLARQAGKFAPGTILGAWLYQVTRRTAIDVVRRESRRQAREQAAHDLNAMNSATTEWASVEPLLDEAMGALDDSDRTAVLLRYFQNKSLREVGETIGTNEDAARKRVSRATERLREFFARRGVTIGVAGLAAVISANAIQAAPVELVARIAGAALSAAKVAAAAASTATTTNAIVMTTLQKAAIVTALAVAGAAAPLILQHRTQIALRQENESLRQQAARAAQLEADNQRLSNLVAQANDQRTLTKKQMTDLLRLRAQAREFQTAAQEMAKSSQEMEKLKAAAASENGDLSMTNMFARAMTEGERRKALARLARMKSALGLTDSQEQAIRDILYKNVENELEHVLVLMSANPTIERMKALDDAKIDADAAIKALLSPDQLAAYPAFEQSEDATAARTSVRKEASEIAAEYGLSTEQQDNLGTALSAFNTSGHTNGPSQEAIDQAEAEGRYKESIDMDIEKETQMLQDKLSTLSGFLTPEQLEVYRAEQMDRINIEASVARSMIATNASAQ